MIDLASLVLAPTAVKDGKVYNAIPNDQDFTFSRGTEATRVNSAGLIEKARTNFALYSNDFSQSVWQKLNNAVVSGQTATDPYGNANNAWDIVFDGTTSGRIEQSISGVISGGVYAPSIWARTKSGTQVVSFGSVFTENFTLTTEWQRISLYEVENDTTAYLRLVCNDAITLEVYAAQLEQGLVATDVITTTTSSVTVGITDDLPRVDYSGGGCPSLLLEGQRTNLYTYSEYSAIWNKTNWTTTDNYAISPEGVKNAFRAVSLNTSGILYLSGSGTTGQDNTLSVWAKSNTGGEQKFRFWGNGNTITSSDFTATTEWQRFDYTYNCAFVTAGIKGASSELSDILFYGFQHEAGSYPTSYIPTYGTSTSRSADSCSLTGASNLIGQSEGTMFVEAQFDYNSTISSNLISVHEGTSAAAISINRESNNRIQLFVFLSATVQANIITTANSNGNYKIAATYKQNDFKLYVNGVSIGTDTSGNIPTPSVVGIGNLAGSNIQGNVIKQALIFPTRLTNDELAELTKL